MNTLIFLSHQATTYVHAFTHALASMGLGMEGAVAYGDDAFYSASIDPHAPRIKD